MFQRAISKAHQGYRPDAHARDGGWSLRDGAGEYRSGKRPENNRDCNALHTIHCGLHC